MNHKQSPLAQAMGLIDSMTVRPITATSTNDTVRLVDGHNRAQAAVELGLPFTVQIDGMNVQMLKQKDGSISGVGPGGRRVTLNLEA